MMSPAISSGISSAAELIESLQPESHTALSYKSQIPASGLSTFALGAAIPLLIEVGGVAALSTLLKRFRADGLSWKMLGAGSNIIFPDDALQEPVLRLGREFSASYLIEGATPSIEELPALLVENGARAEEGVGLRRFDSDASISEAEETRVLALGGAALMGLSRKTAKLGLSGLEFAAGIPASLGGAVRMNAGAHGASMLDCLRTIYWLDTSGELLASTPSDLAFGYRRSGLPSEAIVIAAELGLQPSNPELVQIERSRCLEYRKQTQPLSMPSAGSVFRNPLIGPAAAELLEEEGIKGMRRGGVAFSELHANWLVRTAADARAEDARYLIAHARERVANRFDVELEAEIVLW